VSSDIPRSFGLLMILGEKLKVTIFVLRLLNSNGAEFDNGTFGIQ
jgi:hypothetical protein